MSGILYAWGDGVARGKELPRTRSIDLHPTVLRLVGAQPGSPVDGEVAADLLTP